VRPRRVAERQVERLDREDVGEVGAELEREVELHPAARVIDDDHVILHSVADEAASRDGDLVRLESADRRVPEKPGSRVVLDLPVGE
jgi:hypothetical protein